MMGMDIGFPDVCLTPARPRAGPLPEHRGRTSGVPAAYNVLFMFALAHNMATTVVMTNSDNAGVATGVASGSVMGPSRHLTGAFTCLVGGLPATRVTSASDDCGVDGRDQPGWLARRTPSRERVVGCATLSADQGTPVGRLGRHPPPSRRTPPS